MSEKSLSEIGYLAFNDSRGSMLTVPFNRQPRSVRVHWQAAADAIAAEVKKDLVLCEFPECVSARAVQAAGDEYQRGYAAGLEKAAKKVLTFATAAQAPYQARPVIPADIRAVVNVICRIAEGIRAMSPVEDGKPLDTPR